jgi:hypothetical protein
MLAQIWQPAILSITTLMKHDPYPIYNADNYPYSYLLTRSKNYMKCLTDCYDPEFFSLAISGFYQKANYGRDFDKQKAFLGDLEGRWNMVGMMYGTLPAGKDLTGTQLGRAKVEIYGPSLTPTPNNPNSMVPVDIALTDTGELIGFFSVPLKYRKSGIRFETSIQPVEDFGFTIQGGFADIKQTMTNFIDLTPDSGLYDGFTDTFTTQVEALLMTSTQARKIFCQQGLDTCDFKSCLKWEDLRIFAWWRHIFPINMDEPECEWPHFLFIPFVNFEVSIPTAPKLDRSKAFALSLGNDGHTAIGFTAGFHMDFIRTIEVGAYGGITYFAPRTISDFRVPNSPTQSGVFPFTTTVKKKPGLNGNFGLLMHAYRFIDKLSFWADYAYIQHCEDTITLQTPDPAFFPDIVECRSKWEVHLLNTSLYYELSRNFTVGLVVQWPLKQRNAYRSTTVMGTIQVTF